MIIKAACYLFEFVADSVGPVLCWQASVQLALPLSSQLQLAMLQLM